MTPGLVVLAIALALILCLASYIVRLESQFGRILARDVQQHLEAWEQNVEPRLGMSREQVALSASIWMNLAMALEALVFSRIVVEQWRGWNTDAALQWIVAVMLMVMICSELIPFLLLQRMPGDWLASFTWLVRGLLYLLSPVTLTTVFLLSIATLTEPAPESSHEDEAGDVEALLEAGEEEGILEEEDRQLVRSALEFGDKLVKEVMTPRSAVFAVRETMPLKDFLNALRQHNFSRVPVFRTSLDEVTGIAFAHDLLHLSDAETAQQTVRNIQRPVALVPETKRGYELLREMQREKQHMRVVIDEYGEVAGVVTIEDLLEAIVGEIRDEHEDDADRGLEEAVAEDGGTLLLPGSYPVSRLSELVEDAWPPDTGEYQSQTVGGLISEIADRIPLTGEVIETGKLRLEVVKASERRIEQVRLRRLIDAIADVEIKDKDRERNASEESEASHQE